ncbi:type IV secretion system DNA-binding domain-containing protein [Subtercola sp. PAMC28395]|uniref:type IV secretory system conjugative DNA transfer family protein n=1 Tax=Subtercola sp. PAMC28395 TaxID=2846775 RepID=UPI001C0C012B|nr:type IV secretory system conjugative DNA transfer family protein [Subtercola sp. PAMC28395]QWT22958.1 type IV secretion system DNA-binding domain-containing protein [Subtercola sp. PAMC28395]
MMITNNREEWEWRELTWPDTLTPDQVRNALEQVAASGALGPVVLETRATKAGLRWLIAARPARIENTITVLAAHLAIRAHMPRRVRKPVGHTAELRVSGTDLSLDPARITASIRGLYGALSRLRDGEEVVLQLLLGRRHTPPVRPREPLHAWLKVLAIPPSKPTPASIRKHRDEQHGFSMSVRIGASGVDTARARQMVGDIVGALRVLETSGSRIRAVTGSPVHLNQGALPWRWPLVLTSGQILSFTGWPIGEPPLPLLGGIHPRQLPPPIALLHTDRVIGTASAPGHNEKVGISIRDAAFHTHLLGPTGSAKSTVMLNLITADIHAGRGVLVLDPKGDLADRVLAHVPKNREHDIVVIDPTNAAPVGFNPLRGTLSHASVTADTLLATFESVFSKHWGIRSADIYTAVFNTLAQVDGANLLWIPPLLTNPAFRRKILAGIDDPIGLGGFWAQYDQKTPAQQAEEIGPVLNKLRQLILRPGLRAVLGQSEPTFDLTDLFTNRRIIIVNLNKGLLGADAARLLGTLLIGQLWTRILARQRDGLTHRHIVSIYIDEAADFIAGLPGDLSDALAQARSLGAAFTLANQYLKQFSPAMQAAIETNTRSKIYFGLGGTDASTIAKHTPGLDTQDFLLLPKYHAYANVMQHGQSTGWMSIATSPPPPATGDPAAIYAASHERYGVPAAETEQQIRALIAPTTPDYTDPDDGPIGRTPR